MPPFRLRLINGDFTSDSESAFSSAEAAVRAGLEAATSIARETLLQGEQTTAVEVRVEEDGRAVVRRVINLSVSDLSPEG
jgi:hypothetical protein